MDRTPPLTDSDVVDAVVAAASGAAVLTAAALARPAEPELLGRASAAATSAAERRLVAVVAAYLDGADDRALLLARDHLADHPDTPVAARIAAVLTERTSS